MKMTILLMYDANPMNDNDNENEMTMTMKWNYYYNEDIIV